MAQTFENYKPPEEIACTGRGAWTAVDSDGKSVMHLKEGGKGSNANYYEEGIMIATCDQVESGGFWYKDDGLNSFPRPNNYKYVFRSLQPAQSPGGEAGTAPVGGTQQYDGAECQTWAGGCTDEQLRTQAWRLAIRESRVNRYNFETGMWSNDQGGKYKNGERVE
jgi:hypothetical protein